MASALLDENDLKLSVVKRRVVRSDNAVEPSEVERLLEIVDAWQMGKKRSPVAMNEISYLVAGIKEQGS